MDNIDFISDFYKDLLQYILSYLIVTDVFHPKQTSKKTSQQIKDLLPTECELLNGHVCVLCNKEFKQPSRLNKVIMICSKKHPLSSHFRCWQKWKQQNINVISTYVKCFLKNCDGLLNKIGGTNKQKPTMSMLSKQMAKARLNTFNVILKAHNNP